VGSERRKRRRGGGAALMGDGEEVIETFYDEELDGKKAGCETWK